LRQPAANARRNRRRDQRDHGEADEAGAFHSVFSMAVFGNITSACVCRSTLASRRTF
jgi:hypothetical protein